MAAPLAGLSPHPDFIELQNRGALSIDGKAVLRGKSLGLEKNSAAITIMPLS
jgi:hypothetical protein